MPYKEWIKKLNEKSRLLIRLTTIDGVVVEFAVVLMYLQDKQWECATRYDTAHQTPHRDILGRKKGLIEKDWLFHLPFAQALTYAIEDLEKNHEDYIRYFQSH
jgi:hypothetical protein